MRKILHKNTNLACMAILDLSMFCDETDLVEIYSILSNVSVPVSCGIRIQPFDSMLIRIKNDPGRIRKNVGFIYKQEIKSHFFVRSLKMKRIRHID